MAHREDISLNNVENLRTFLRATRTHRWVAPGDVFERADAILDLLHRLLRRLKDRFPDTFKGTKRSGPGYMRWNGDTGPQEGFHWRLFRKSYTQWSFGCGFVFDEAQPKQAVGDGAYFIVLHREDPRRINKYKSLDLADFADARRKLDEDQLFAALEEWARKWKIV